MKKEEFYQRLFNGIQDFSKSEQKEVQEYYEELICDGIEAGVPEEEVIAHLEKPEQIAARLHQEHETSKKIKNEKDNSSHTCESKEPVTKVVLKAKDRGFTVSESTDQQVHVYFEKGEFDEVICNESDGTFYFRLDTKRGLSFARFFSHSQVDGKIEVKLPKKLETVEVQTSNGGVQTRNIDTTGSLHLSSTNGGVSARGCSSSKMLLTTTNGGIKMENLIARDLGAETVNAAITFEDITADKINLETCNGSIKGSLNGRIEEYAIMSHTQNGSSNLPTEFNMDQPKKLRANTINGRIHVDFHH